jgi:hypothetical protein
MPPPLSDYTWAFGDSGFVLNTDSMALPFVDITQVTGLDSAPLRTSTDEHQGQDGTYVDSPYMSMRTIVLSGTLYTPSADPDTLLLRLRREYTENLVKPFYFQLPGQNLRYLNGQGAGCQYDINQARRSGQTPIQFTVLCGDPYIYDYPQQVASVGLASVTTVGMGFNAFFNMSFGGSIPNSNMVVTNGGTHTAYPVITLQGPIYNPALVDFSSGITMSFSINLGAADSLVIDCKNKSVVLNGNISRRTSLAGLNWFSVPPGVTETIGFSAAAGTGYATVRLNSTYY